MHMPRRRACDRSAVRPYHATVDELAGLPTHLISVNELDAVRDEGVAYCQRLQRARFAASLRTVSGACHSADMIFPAQMPDTASL